MGSHVAEWSQLPHMYPSLPAVLILSLRTQVPSGGPLNGGGHGAAQVQTVSQKQDLTSLPLRPSQKSAFP